MECKIFVSIKGRKPWYKFSSIDDDFETDVAVAKYLAEAGFVRNEHLKLLSPGWSRVDAVAAFDEDEECVFEWRSDR